ncbi:MAG TPA: hypothetical protein VH986_14100 [Acidimicrobiia bacterium]
MTMPGSLRLHAIYAVLDDVRLFQASLASIYPFVESITVVTTHDRDWKRVERMPSEIPAVILSRDLDPDRKIDLIVTNETNEARTRNRVMDFAAPRAHSLEVKPQHRGDHALQVPDYFLIVDADEIYEEGAIDRIKGYVARDRLPLYRVPCVRYFKRWNYRIEGFEWAVSLVRADQRLPYLRQRTQPLLRRVASRVPGLPASWRDRMRGFADVPPAVGMFHHGSYVGPRSRIAAKVRSFGHADEVAASWLTDVYDRWTPGSRNFNPAFPELFAAARRVDVDTLPREIRDHHWPEDYLER